MPNPDTAPATRNAPAYARIWSGSVLLQVDHAEHARRQAAGLGALTNLGTLDLLMTLPEGMAVPVATLSDSQRRALRRLPAGTVTTADQQVTRLAVRPVRAVLATVRGRCSRTSLERASKFAPFCSRRVLTRVRPDLETLIEYDFYGVGVTYQHADGAEESLSSPRPWVPQRHTPAGWWFAERAYDMWLREAPGPGRGRSER
jgi:hypothetical protein